ncbi:sigma-E factor negative regulatory protein [Rhodanobacter umsongensis]|uniref:Sigma-E factor negative regulatory protein n=1 Tax=Rhodanobacter umsongensis TaxID=633153 RepID=A0ABW0JHE0_9GAMM
MKQAGKNQAGNQADIDPNVPESLSAGIDGELSKEQLRFLLRRLDHDPALQQTWTRYHLARDSLRQQLPPMAAAGFAERVMQAISEESAPAGASRRSHWLRWSTGGAIAASVAAAALMIGQPTGDAERMTASTARQGSAVAVAASAVKSTMPAAVPPWLSGNSAGLLSQQASATLGAPFGPNQPAYGRRLSAYPSMHRYRTLDNDDGSYLLLLDPSQQVAPGTARQATAAQ